jgi:hypothetical protein
LVVEQSLVDILQGFLEKTMLSDFRLQSASVTYYSVVDDGWQKQEGSACL